MARGTGYKLSALPAVAAVTAAAVMIALAVVVMLPARAFAGTVYETEDNGAYSTADIVGMDSTVVGRCTDSDDEDFYRLTPSADGKISLTFKHTYENSSYGWAITVYKYDGGSYTEMYSCYVDLCDAESYALPFVGAVSGERYYVKVEPQSYQCPSGVEYRLAVGFTKSSLYEKEMNETYQTATAVSAGCTYHGNCMDSDDEDFYCFKPSADGKISLTFKHTYENSGDGWAITVCKYDGGSYTEMYSCRLDLCDAESYALPFVGAVSGERYYVKVEPQSYQCPSGVEYRLAVGFTKSSVYEKEFNDSYSEATAISLGKTYTGNCMTSSDADYYRFTAASSGTLALSFTHTVNTKVYGRWTVTLYRYQAGSYTQVTYKDIAIGDASKVTVPVSGIVKGGKYYVSVKCSSSDLVGRQYKIYANAVASIANASAKTVAARTYTGKSQKPSPTLTYGGVTLKKGVDYTLSYKNNTKVGTATITVKGIGAFKGTKTVTFKINPKSTKVTSVAAGSKSFTVKWSKQAVQTTGYQVKYSRNANMSNANIKTVSSTLTTSKKISVSYGKTKYYVQVRTYKVVNGKTYYSAWSAKKTVTTKA